MLKKLALSTIALGAFVLVVMPFSVNAENTVTVTDTAGLTDISADVGRGGGEGDAEEAFFAFCDGDTINGCDSITSGTEFEFTFSVTGDDAENGPAMVFVMGADMEYDNRWSYNYNETSATGTLTVPAIKRTFYDEDGNKIPVIAVSTIFPVAEGEDGPPTQMNGSYLASTVMDNEMVPPSPGNPAFGFTLTGATGTSGFVHFYIPPALIDLLSYYENIDLTPADMAVFMDDEQVSATITETDSGGALVEIDVIFTAGDTATSNRHVNGRISSVTKTVVAKQKLPISLTAKKARLKKGKTAKIYGWLRNAKKDKKVRIYQKKKGQSKFTLFKKVTTRANGYFFYKFTPNKAGTYYYKARYTKSNGSKLNSARENLKVSK